jgi:hypothetical protein
MALRGTIFENSPPSSHFWVRFSIDQCPRAHFNNASALARDLESGVIELRFVQ